MTLATRVSLFFLATLATVLAGSSAVTYLLAREQIHRGLDERLMVGLDGLASAVDVSPNRIAWDPAARVSAGDAHPDEAPPSWAVFDPRGALIAGTRDGSEGAMRAGLRLTPPVGHVHLSVTAPDGRRWRLVSRQLGPVDPPPRRDEEEDEPPPRSAAEPGPIVVMGTPTATMDGSLTTLAWTLAASSAGLWLVAATVGQRLCRRALRPLLRMAAGARGMSPTDPSARLPSPGTGDELEDLARSFNDLLGRFHEAIERQGRFAGDASHQLRTPLTALIGEIELARRRDRSPHEYRQILSAIHGDAVRLHRIVESLLFLARTDSDAGRPDLDPVDLGRWLPAHLDHRDRDARSADLRREIVPGPIAAKVHPALLGELVDNLLDNALKYSSPGTPVVVRLAREPGFVTLAVEDLGVGISPEDLPRVFDPFFRSATARLRGEPGVGLGLSVARRIVASFGGTITIASEPGRGSRVVVRLPEAAALKDDLVLVPSPPGRGLG